jgi:hypothetical protein
MMLGLSGEAINNEEQDLSGIALAVTGWWDADPASVL